MRRFEERLRIGEGSDWELPSASEAGTPSGGGAFGSEGEEGAEAGFGEGVVAGEGVDEEGEERALPGRELGWEEVLEEVLDGLMGVLVFVREGLCFHRG